MPKFCTCMKCERFRDNMAPSRITQASLKALEKANTPHENSLRKRVARGEGRNGGKKTS